MSTEEQQPRQFDAVFGGEMPPPLEGVVLGGIEGAKNRLASSNIKVQLAALQDALNYQLGGLDVVIDALEHKSTKVQRFAAKLLADIEHKKAQLALDKYKFWHKFEKYYEIPCNYAKTFANRKIINFDPEIGIHDTVNIAYSLRLTQEEYYNKSVFNSVEKLQLLQESMFANQIEALVFGAWHTKSLRDYTFQPIVDELLNAHGTFTNLKALFLGDVNITEWGNLPLIYCNLSYILLAYPQLEILQVRSNCHRYYNLVTGLEFCSVKHEKLKAIIIEYDYIHDDFLHEICKLELPALEYLELWIQEDRFYPQYAPHELMISFSQIFPKLKYLGLRHSDYSDKLAFAIANSPIIESLVELDISAGNMTDEGAKALLNSPTIEQLDTLDISYNCLSNEMVEKINQLDIQVISEGQYPYSRYYPTNE